MPMSQTGTGCWRDGDNEPVRVMLDSKEEVSRVLESHGFWFDDENLTVKAKLPERETQEQENTGVGSELHVEGIPTEQPVLRADRSEPKRRKKKGA
jgi:hypothetical protein